MFKHTHNKRLLKSNISVIITAPNTVISPNFLVWKFSGKAQFPHSFGRFARNYAETVSFHKISTRGNYMKLRYFSQGRDMLRQAFFLRLLFPISRDLKLDARRSNLYFMLKELLFFFNFYSFSFRRHSLKNRPSYNNLFQIIQ